MMAMKLRYSRDDNDDIATDYDDEEPNLTIP